MTNYIVTVVWSGKKQVNYFMPGEDELDAALKVGIHWHSDFNSGYILEGVKEAPTPPPLQFPKDEQKSV